MSAATCFFTEFLGTVLLVLMVLAATDKKNNGPPNGLLPLTLFLTLLGLGIALGMQTCKQSILIFTVKIFDLRIIQHSPSTPRVTSDPVFF
jgi:hypothetical protein